MSKTVIENLKAVILEAQSNTLDVNNLPYTLEEVIDHINNLTDDIIQLEDKVSELYERIDDLNEQIDGYQ